MHQKNSIMDKEVFKKVIESHGCLNSTDLSANEKKALVYLMGKYGATMGTGGKTYDRFFKSGFCTWEILGINTLKWYFLEKMINNKEGDGIPNVNKLSDKELNNIVFSKGEFYKYISQIRGLKSYLIDMMNQAGMKSPTTIRKRFEADDWKSYELVGIKYIIGKFCEMNLDEFDLSLINSKNIEAHNTTSPKTINVYAEEQSNSQVIPTKSVVTNLPFSLYKSLYHHKIETGETINNILIRAIESWLELDENVRIDYEVPKGEVSRGVLAQIPKNLYDALAIRKIHTGCTLKKQCVFAIAYWLNKQIKY